MDTLDLYASTPRASATAGSATARLRALSALSEPMRPPPATQETPQSLRALLEHERAYLVGALSMSSALATLIFGPLLIVYGSRALSMGLAAQGIGLGLLGAVFAAALALARRRQGQRAAWMLGLGGSLALWAGLLLVGAPAALCGLLLWPLLMASLTLSLRGVFGIVALDLVGLGAFALVVGAGPQAQAAALLWSVYAGLYIMVGAMGALLSRSVARQRASLREAHAQAEAARAAAEREHAIAQAALRQAREALSAKNHFLAYISHEVRTSVNVIQGYTELLMEEGMEYPQLLADLDRVHVAGKQLSGVIHDVHELARQDAAQEPLRLQVFSSAQLVQGVRKELEAKAKAKGNALRLHVESATFKTDLGLVGKLLTSLVTHACRGTDRGELEVYVRPHRDPGWVLIEVHDTGEALSQETLDAVFERAEAAQDGPRQARRIMAGLPLMLARRLAARLGGQLEVSAKPGRGSVVTATLPLEQDQAVG